MKIIYDFGSNNGDDIMYYMMKSDLVVAVEANPNLCDLIINRFKKEIDAAKLVVENHVLSTAETEKKVPFYIHNSNHVLSQFPKPDLASIDNFTLTDLTAVTPAHLFSKYGDPYYIKIDLESYDKEILMHIFKNRIFPKYISAEIHSPEIFCTLVAFGNYNAFKLIEGDSVSKIYKNRDIDTGQGLIHKYSFPHHSAGPFGDDVDGDWLSTEDMLMTLGLYGCGWKDIHATYDPSIKNSSFLRKKQIASYIAQKAKEKIKTLLKIR